MQNRYSKEILNEGLLEAEIEVNLSEVTRKELIANEHGFALHKIKKVNKATFVQIIKENLDILIQKKYLTNAELGFVLSILPLIEMNSNGIVNDEGQFLTVSEIARYLDRNVSNTSTMINKLIEKGIIYEFVDAYELRQFKRSVTQRPFFINPEIVYCGDRNKINATLSRLIITYDRLEKKKILLNWKLWIHSNEEYGKLYRRKTYLGYKKATKRK